MRRLALLALLPLAACATVPDAQQSIFVLQGALTTAIQTATGYARLPRCSTVAGTSVVCSDPATLARIDAAADSAASMITSAEAVVTDPNTSASARSAAVADATDAVTELTKLTGAVK